jgi:hypothetical protein
MAHNVQSLAAANGEACDDRSHLTGRDALHDTSADKNNQYELLARVRKNQREEFRVAIRQFNHFRGVEIRLFKLNGQGAFIDTGRALAMRFTTLPEIVAALQLASEAGGLS